MRAGSVILLSCLGFIMLGAVSVVAGEESTVYELRVYTCLPDRLSALQARFRDHTCRLFEKHGMQNVAYWVPADGDESRNTLIYIVKHKSREAAKASWDAFRADPVWHAARDASEKDGKIVEKVESTYMQSTGYSPSEVPLDPSKSYELRIYTTNDGRLDALHARFREHTLKLFEKYGMQNVAYFTPADEPKSKNTLIYFIAHSSREAAAASWKAFGSDAEWKKVVEESQRDGKILAERPISKYLTLTDYSPQGKK